MHDRRRRLSTPELVLAGAAATLSGIGLARFAYTPLVPAMVEAGWFDAVAAAYLGAANLLGYLVGAVVAHRLASAFGLAVTVRAALAAVVLSFLLSALPAPFVWFFLWRFVSGVAGGMLMVLGPSAVLTAIPERSRRRAGALVFTGVGVGVLLSATVVPVLAARALSWAWLVLGGLSLIAAAGSWRIWGWLTAGGDTHAPDAISSRDIDSPAVPLVLVAYATSAVGMVPHTVFWVDYVARGLGQGLAAGGVQWALFGLGALSGPPLAGWLAQRIGYRRGLGVAFVVMGAGVAVPLVTANALALSVSSIIVGAEVLAIVALTSGRIAELVGPARHRQVWGWATGTFAVGQAAAGYGMSAMFDLTGDYLPLFAVAAAILLAGAACAAAGRRQRSQVADMERQ